MLGVCFARAGSPHAAVGLAFKHCVIIIECSCELARMQPSSDQTQKCMLSSVRIKIRYAKIFRSVPVYLNIKRQQVVDAELKL